MGTPAVYGRCKKVTVDLLPLAGYTTLFLMLLNLLLVAGQRSLFGLGRFFVSNLLTSAGLWSLFCLWFIRQNFCADNLPTVAGQRPVFGPMTITCQPQQVSRHFSEMRSCMSATCLPPQVYGHFSDIA